MKWTPLIPKNSSPEARKLCTMNYYDNSLYIIGGFDHKLLWSDLWKFSLTTMLWKELKTNELLPKCGAHRSVSYKHYIIVIGGKTFDSDRYSGGPWKALNDLYALNLSCNDSEYKWRRVNGSNKPESRGKHGLCLYNNLLIMYGGISDSILTGKDRNLNSMYIVNVNNIITDNEAIWIKIDVNLPHIYSHFISCNSNIIYCFGGKKDKNETRTNQLIQFYNIDGESLTSKVTPLISGYLHNIIDTYSIEFTTDLWIEIQRFVGLIYFIKNLGKIDARAGHYGCYLNDINKLFIFGGYNGNNVLNDYYFI